MMKTTTLALALSLAVAGVAPSVAPAAEAADVQQLQADVQGSLVIVEFTYDYEMGRQELRALGVVVRDDGTTLVPLEFVNTNFPDDYLTDFKIILPPDEGVRDSRVELDAKLLARDERYNLAYVRPVADEEDEPATQPAEGEDETPEVEWRPVEFVASELSPGQALVTVSRMNEAAAYQPYVSESRLMTVLRGQVPQALVSTAGLGMVGSPVFDADGRAVGVVHTQSDFLPFIDLRNTGMEVAIGTPPRLFRPASDFADALSSIPETEDELRIPWLGVASLEGVERELAKFLDIENVTAIVVGDVIDGYPAAEGGLQDGDIIVKVNGEPLERVDTPEEAPQIFTRDLTRMPVDEEVTLSVLRGGGPDAEEQELTVTLAERPEQQASQPRTYFEDLGFTVRDVVFADAYSRKMPADTPGVVVSFIRPQSAAQTATPEGLAEGDLIQKLNQDAVTDAETFEAAYNAFREENPDEAVVLEVLRGIDTKIIRVEPPQE